MKTLVRPILIPALLTAAIYPFAQATAQTSFEWTGNESANWSTAANWNPAAGAPPGTDVSDAVLFDIDSLNNQINLSNAVTVSLFQFGQNSGDYTFSGEGLTISAPNNGIFLSHESGGIQTFNNNVTLNSTGGSGQRIIHVGADSTLNLLGGLTAAGATDTNIRLEGGGVMTMEGTAANINGLTVADVGTVLNYNTSNSGRPYTLTVTDGARINLDRTSYAGTLQLRGDNSSIYTRVAGTIASGSNTLRFRPEEGTTQTFGASINSPETAVATYNRVTVLNFDGPVDNATMRLEAGANNVLNMTGEIRDEHAAGNNTVLEVAGEGIVRFSGSTANTSLTPIVISDGTLELAKDEGVNAIAGGEVTIEENGLLSLQNSNQIADVTNLTFAGGTFALNGFNETLGALSVGSQGGMIDFGGLSGILAFASVESISGSLIIRGWDESIDIIFQDGSGWNDETLALVTFEGIGGAQFDFETGRLSAIPEPSTVATLFGLFGLGLALIKRRRTKEK